jgi:hypothetical protein
MYASFHLLLSCLELSRTARTTGSCPFVLLSPRTHVVNRLAYGEHVRSRFALAALVHKMDGEVVGVEEAARPSGTTSEEKLV